MADIKIYTKFMCPYCARATALLDSKNVRYSEIDITWSAVKREEMLRIANGRTTVPQIFVNGLHVGGSDDLAALEANGKLDLLIEA
jgi:glutaredoxin 3